MSHRSATVVAAVNDEQLLENTLMRSPDIASGRAPLITMRHARSASAAYNAGLDQSDTDLIIFAHQDVYLPEGWLDRLLAAANALDREAPYWGIVGLYGVAPAGRHVGRVWAGDHRRELIGAAGTSGAVQSLDEIVLVLRHDRGLRFDTGLPHFHMYGTDIVQIGLSAGFSAHVIEAPVIHNAVPVVSLDGGFAQGYRYMRRKWRDRLPITTTMTRITRSGLPLLRGRLSHWRRKRHTKGVAERVDDVRRLAAELGYE